MLSNGLTNFENANRCSDLSSGVESGGSEDEFPVTQKQRYVKEDVAQNRFMSLPNKGRHEKFLRTFVEEVMQRAVFTALERDQKVLEWTNPEDLLETIDYELKPEPDSDERLLELARDVIKYSVKTGHPYFVNQLFSSVDAYALAGQWLTDALNPSVYTYEVAPVFILMEEVVLKEMRQIVGWPQGKGDGIFFTRRLHRKRLRNTMCTI